MNIAIRKDVKNTYKFWQSQERNMIREAFLEGGRFYASRECVLGMCGYEVRHGYCVAVQRDMLLKELIENDDTSY